MEKFKMQTKQCKALSASVGNYMLYQTKQTSQKLVIILKVKEMNDC